MNIENFLEIYLNKAKRRDDYSQELASENIKRHMKKLGKYPGGRKQAVAIGISQARRGETEKSLSENLEEEKEMHVKKSEAINSLEESLTEFVHKNQEFFADMDDTKSLIMEVLKEKAFQKNTDKKQNIPNIFKPFTLGSTLEQGPMGNVIKNIKKTSFEIESQLNKENTK